MKSPFHEFSRALRSFAVPGLIRYVVFFNALVFLLHLLAPGYLSVLELDPSRVLDGQVWRLLTWIFIPETMSPFWVFFALLFLLYVGDGLEAAVGSATLTQFYTCGVCLCTAVAFTLGLSGHGAHLANANSFLNLSLLLAYATVYPDFKVLVFFVLPLRIVWLAVISAVLMILSAVGQPPVVAATLGAAFLNYFLFFGKILRPQLSILKSNFNSPRRVTRPITEPRDETAETFHRCHACGRTEITDPHLEFRVSSDGEEYCRDHPPR
jgi:hypothetical protein